MLCRMPALNLPNDFIKELENTESGTIDGTQGPGVATSSHRGVRVDIYIGFEMNGFKLYQNISVGHPSIKLQFALKPRILCQSDVLRYKPNKDNTLTIQVRSNCSIHLRAVRVILVAMLLFIFNDYFV